MKGRRQLHVCLLFACSLSLNKEHVRLLIERMSELSDAMLAVSRAVTVAVAAAADSQ